MRTSLASFLLVVALSICSAATAQDGEGGALFADGFESGNTLAWDNRVPPLPAPDAFRIVSLELRDPHVFVDLPVFGCVDFTDDPLPAGLGPSFNDSLATAIDGDDDGDGFLDLSLILAFRPFDATASDERLDAGCGLCTDPAATTVCDWDLEVAIPRTSPYDGLAAGTCLEPLAGTTSGYSPPVPTTVAPCVVSEISPAPLLVLVIDGVPIVLEESQLSGSLVGAPVFRLEDGLVRGFLSEAVADTIQLPGPAGPITLSSLLPGGTDSCAPGNDRDLLDGVSGWWFYLEQDAEAVPFIGD